MTELPDYGLAETLESYETPQDVTDWLALAKMAYHNSTDYLDANVRQDIEVCLAHHNNQHASGTRYARPDYKGRSKSFRPKTRTNNIAAEAALAKALFSTDALVNVAPVDPDNDMQRAGAEVTQWVMDHRLRNSIKWYATAIGAYQDCRVVGTCFSYQGWEVVEDEDGRRLVDRPVIDLIPFENMRLEPNADWRDPINTSAFIIRLVPKYAADAAELIRQNPDWHQYDLGEIIGAGRDSEQQHDTTRQARQGDRRTDPADQSTGTSNEFQLVWLHENYIRVGGQDMVFWTIGTRRLLSDPVPVQEAYPHLRPFERPFAAGNLLLEAHKIYPNSPSLITAPLQQELNEIVNQRIDNVRLAMNKRYIVRKGANIDMASLARSVPGGGVVAGDPTNDVRELNFSDVTGNSYVEQDRLDLAIDEVSGVFSQQSVASNRNLNETVGGMNLMNAGANDTMEYMVRNFIETWVEPVLSQVQRLIAYYENDQTLLALAAQQSEAFHEFGQGVELDELLRHDLVVSVNAGFGAINPQQKVERMMTAMSAIASMPTALMKIDEDEVISEVFGALGFRGGKRFLLSEKELEERAAAQGQGDPAKMLDLEIKQAKLQLDTQLRQYELDIAQERWAAELELKRELEMQRMALDEGLKLSEMNARLGIEAQKDQTKRQSEAARLAIEQTLIALKENNLRQGYDTFG